MKTIQISDSAYEELKEFFKEESEPDKITNLKNFNLSAQYKQAIDALHAFDISTLKAPNIKLIRKALTKELLKKLDYMEEPMLIIVPPISRQELVKKLNKSRFVSCDTYFCNIEDDELWGECELEKWKVYIAEGVNNPVDLHQGGLGDCFDKYKTSFELKGLGMINSAQIQLKLIMNCLSQGREIGSGTITVLTKGTLVAYSYFDSGTSRAVFDAINPGTEYARARGRASVQVRFA